jgi:hypothetical protein
MQDMEKKTQDVGLETLALQLSIIHHFLLGWGPVPLPSFQPLAFFTQVLAFTQPSFTTLHHNLSC